MTRDGEKGRREEDEEKSECECENRGRRKKRKSVKKGGKVGRKEELRRKEG